MYYICNMKNKKEKIVTIRISEKEYDILNKNADKLGLSPSSYLRMCGLKNKIEWEEKD